MLQGTSLRKLKWLEHECGCRSTLKSGHFIIYYNQVCVHIHNHVSDLVMVKLGYQHSLWSEYWWSWSNASDPQIRFQFTLRELEAEWKNEYNHLLKLMLSRFDELSCKAKILVARIVFT